MWTHPPSQSKPVRALSDPCGPLLFMLGIHTATPESQWKESAPLERGRRTATQKSHAVSTHETVDEFSKSGSFPVASLRVLSRRVGRLDGPLVHGGELTSMPNTFSGGVTLQNSRIIRLLRSVQTDVKRPPRNAQAVRGAWQGMAERAVTPGGSASTVAGHTRAQTR